MKHPSVKKEQLARRLQKAAGVTSRTLIAQRAKVDVSRISKILNGDFKRMTPVVMRICKTLNVPWKDCVVNPGARSLPREIIVVLQRIVGRDARKERAAKRLVRSLEILMTTKNR